MKLKSVYNLKELVSLKKKFHWSKYIADLSYFHNNLIPDNCFKSDNGLVKIIGSTELEVVGTSAFEMCTSLDYVDAQIGAINKRAFANCGNLKEFNFKNTTFIDKEAFIGSGLKSIRLEKCETISEYAFADCFCLSNVILKNVKHIKDFAFQNASIQKIIIPSTVIFSFA